MNILQTLFGKRSEPPPLLEQLKKNVSSPPHEAWPKLAALGYTMQKVVHPTDRNGYASYRMLDNGIPVTEWEHDITWQTAVNRREQYAKMELKRLAELEQEASEK